MIRFLYNPADGSVHHRQSINPFHNPDEFDRDLALLAGPDGTGLERLGLREILVDVAAEPGSHIVEIEDGNIRIRHIKEGEAPGQVLSFRDLARAAHAAQQAPAKRTLMGLFNFSEVVRDMRRCTSWRICRGANAEAFVHRRCDGVGAPPAVSVVIPVWNMAEFIGDTLASIFSQEVEGGLEVIAVDNGSVDTSLAVLERAADKHPNMTIVRLAHNLGQAVARNLSIDLARGQFIAPFDADDIYLPGGIQHLLDAFSDDVDVVYGHCVRYDQTMTQELGRAPWLEQDIAPHTLAKSCCCLPSQQLIRRSLFVERGFWYAEYMCWVEDYEWLLNAWSHDVQFRRIPTLILKRRCHPGSDSYGVGVTHYHKLWTASVRRQYGVSER